jgi:hypothetical protein
MSIRVALTRHAAWIVAAGLLLFCTVPAQAALIVNVQSVSAPAGSNNDMLDVTLTNTGPGSVIVGAFSFGLSVSTPNITFTQATIGTTTAPYIFDGMGLSGSVISTSPPGQSLQASDLFSVIGSGASVGSGVTVGLGHVFFNVAPGATPGPVTVSVTPFPATSLSDPNAVNIPINTLNGGIITVTPGATVPEPSALLLAGLGWPAAWLLRRRRAA